MLKRKAGIKTALMPVIKAQAYGCGAEMVAKALFAAGARFFAVANIEEAFQLRAKGIGGTILNLGEVEAPLFHLLDRAKITQTVYSMVQFKKLSNWAAQKKQRLSVHIKIDTGMGRLGFQQEEILPLIKLIKGQSSLKILGVYSHYPKANDASYSIKQCTQFKKIINLFEKEGLHIKWRHIDNSEGIILFNNGDFTLARPGIALFGLSPMQKKQDILKLAPVLSLKTRVIQVKKISAGTPISYNHTFTAKKETNIATLSIGYSDGLNRKLSNKGRVIIRENYYPIVGTITMNFTMVDIGKSTKIKEGDTAILIGKSGGKEITMQEVADKINTINYEIQTSISANITRRYIKSGKQITIRNINYS
jgi:alanine racemase